MKSAIRVRVIGLVQGVYFRASTQIKANKLDSTGWVKNTDNGEAHIEATGSEESLKKLTAWLYKALQFALVKQVVESIAMSESFDGFDIL